MFQIADGRRNFYQWDTGQKIKLDDAIQCSELQYTNNGKDLYGRPVDEATHTCPVPWELLQEAKPVTVYGYTPSYTLVSRKFEVQARPRPENIIYTEEDLKTYAELSQQIKDQIAGMVDEHEKLEVEFKQKIDTKTNESFTKIDNKTNDAVSIATNTINSKKEAGVKALADKEAQVKADLQNAGTGYVNQMSGIKNEAQTLLNQADNKMIQSIDQTTSNTGSSEPNTVEVTLKDGSKYPFTVYNGARGEQGDTGAPFTIAKTYRSIAEMNAGYATDGVAIGSFVAIDTGNVEDVDNAKLFLKGETQYTYITDMSGATGLTGPKGDTGQYTAFQYYASTSSETPTGGSWSSTMPSIAGGKFLFMRTQVVPAGGTLGSNWSTPTLAGSDISKLMATIETVDGKVKQNTASINANANNINALEACHLESRDDGIHLIVKTEENNG